MLHPVVEIIKYNGNVSRPNKTINTEPFSKKSANRKMFCIQNQNGITGQVAQLLIFYSSKEESP